MKISAKKSVIITLIILIILVILLSRINLHKTFKAFVGVSWIWIICSGSLNILNTWVEAIRWKLILSSVKKNIHVRRTFASILVGVVGNIILPFRLGDGVRAYFLAKKECIPLASVLSTVLLDRVADVISFLLFVAVTAFLFHLPSSVTRACLIAGAFVSFVLVILIISRKFSHRIKQKSQGRFRQKLSEQINHFLIGLSALRSKGLFFPTSIISIISWIIRLMMVWTMTKAFRLGLPLVAAMVVLILTNLGIAIVSTPANVGGFELSAVAAYRLFIKDTEIALSCAIALHLVEVIPIALLGLVIIWHNGFSLKFTRELQSLLKTENDDLS